MLKRSATVPAEPGRCTSPLSSCQSLHKAANRETTYRTSKLTTNLDEHSPNSVETSPQLVETRRNEPHLVETKGPILQKIGRNWPDSARVWPRPIKVGRPWPRFGRDQPKACQSNWVEQSSLSVKISPKLFDNRPNSAEMPRCLIAIRPNLGVPVQICPTTTHFGSN